MTEPHPLTAARRADTDRRRTRVLHALAEMAEDSQQISVSAVAARAGVHRSFLHRHNDLHQVVIAAQQATPTPGGQASAPSTASLRADNANLAERNRRLQQHIHLLEERLSVLLGNRRTNAAGWARHRSRQRSNANSRTHGSRTWTCDAPWKNARKSSARSARHTDASWPTETGELPDNTLSDPAASDQEAIGLSQETVRAGDDTSCVITQLFVGVMERCR